MDDSSGAADKRLGMDRPIARRDFLQGAAIAVGASALGVGVPGVARADGLQDFAGYYPPVLTGMRGSHPGSFEVAHSLRDGTFWKSAPAPQPGEQDYDLVIVGGGISGLSAAHFYRAQKPDAKILILENHDDFGGHAKRNEFALDGHLELINGGTLEIDSPRPYSKVADGLIRSLGIDPVAFEDSYAKKDFYKAQGLGSGVFFDKETFGADHLATGVHDKPVKEVLAGAPLNDTAKADIARLEESAIDYMPGLSSDEKKARLWRISYKDYLLNIAKCDPQVVTFYQNTTCDEWGVGIDAISALDVWGFGQNAGFGGLNLAPGSTKHMGYTPAGYEDGSSYTFHFPDGNASIARLLVRSLIPAAIPGKSAQDVVLARADYTQLDRAGAPVRIRLSSIVVGVRNTGAAAAPDGVEIAYSRFGALYRVRARNCILASWAMMTPYLCPELPQKQKDALHYLVKTPLVYTSVAIRNWRAFAKLGVFNIYAPGSYHPTVRLNPVVEIGGYAPVRQADDPIIVRMVKTPCKPGFDEREQNRIGRAALLATSFEDFERRIRDQMNRMLVGGGFDAARDITAITVNRWPHGYAYEYNYLFDPEWAPGQAPHEIGRARFGRIAMANSDLGAAAYTDSAINQGYRAVQDILALS